MKRLTFVLLSVLIYFFSAHQAYGMHGAGPGLSGDPSAIALATDAAAGAAPTAVGMPDITPSYEGLKTILDHAKTQILLTLFVSLQASFDISDRDVILKKYYNNTHELLIIAPHLAYLRDNSFAVEPRMALETRQLLSRTFLIILFELNLLLNDLVGPISDVSPSVDVIDEKDVMANIAALEGLTLSDDELEDVDDAEKRVKKEVTAQEKALARKIGLAAAARVHIPYDAKGVTVPIVTHAATSCLEALSTLYEQDRLLSDLMVDQKMLDIVAHINKKSVLILLSFISYWPTPQRPLSIDDWDRLYKFFAEFMDKNGALKLEDNKADTPAKKHARALAVKEQLRKTYQGKTDALFKMIHTHWFKVAYLTKELIKRCNKLNADHLSAFLDCMTQKNLHVMLACMGGVDNYPRDPEPAYRFVVTNLARFV